MGTIAAYDAIADWYADYISDEASEFTHRVHGLLRQLLGHAGGADAELNQFGRICVDLGCGTGAHSGVLRELGWSPIGIDLSAAQLRYAISRLPVACADAAALPIRSESAPSVTALLCHTDVPDYAAVIREAARILKPGGRFVHVGVHPCFVGAFADRSDVHRVIIDSGYHRRERRFDSFTDRGVRARVGATQTPLPDLLHGALDAGLTISRVMEAGPEGAVPDILGFSARKPN